MSMFGKHTRAITILVGAFAGVAAFAAADTGIQLFSKPPNIADVLKDNGYLEIRPATNLYGPGMIVAVESMIGGSVKLRKTCNMDAAEVSALWQSSPSVDTNIVKALGGKFTLGAVMLGALGLDAGVVDDIQVRLENTRIVTLSEESRSGLEQKYLTGACLTAVKKMISSGKMCVTQPIEVMQADVNYHVAFSNSVEASLKASSLAKISGTLSVGGHADSGDNIVGKGLFFGLKLDTNCIVPNDGESAKSAADMPALKISDAAAHSRNIH